MNIADQPWLIAILSTITAFFFGKTGILQKGFDYIIGRSREEEVKESLELEKRAKQIDDLKKQVDELKMTISKLDKDLVKTTTYVKTLLSYLETLIPEGNNLFIAEIAKEIRSNSNIN